MLLATAADVSGLSVAMREGLSRWRKPTAVHDPGKVVTELAVTLALGGDCLSDAAVIRDEPGIYGRVASEATVSRTITTLARDADRVLAAVAAARRSARARAWELAGEHAPNHAVTAEDPLVVDLDATRVTAHSDKEQAAPNFKRGYGFHPLCAFVDHGAAGTGEALAIRLRPGNAGNAGESRQLVRQVSVVGAGALVVAAATELLVMAGDQFSPWIIAKASNGDPSAGLKTMISAGFGAGDPDDMLGLWFVVYGVCLLGLIVRCIFMLIRSVALVAMMAMVPTVAAGAASDEGWMRFKRFAVVIVGFALYKPVSAVIYAVAISEMTQQNRGPGQRPAECILRRDDGHDGRAGVAGVHQVPVAGGGSWILERVLGRRSRGRGGGRRRCRGRADGVGRGRRGQCRRFSRGCGCGCGATNGLDRLDGHGWGSRWGGSGRSRPQWLVRWLVRWLTGWRVEGGVR